jgi:hypothetical protein
LEQINFLPYYTHSAQFSESQPEREDKEMNGEDAVEVGSSTRERAAGKVSKERNNKFNAKTNKKSSAEAFLRSMLAESNKSNFIVPPFRHLCRSFSSARCIVSRVNFHGSVEKKKRGIEKQTTFLEELLKQIK